METKTAMIWGANGGIGRALVSQLTTAGWQILTVCRDVGPFEEDDSVIALEMTHITAEASLQQVVMEAGYEIDAVDLWVYTVGDITSAKVADMSLTGWQKIIDANLTGAFLATNRSLPLLAPKAHLMFVGAVQERLRLPGLAAYAAAKAGLEAFAEALRKELRKHPVTVVRPGAVDTSFWDKVPLKLPKDAMTPAKVADKMIEAYEAKHKGLLDLTH